MALFNFPLSSSHFMNLNDASEIVPERRRQRIKNFSDFLELAREFKLGREAQQKLSENGKLLVQEIKPFLTRYAIDLEGRFTKTWKRLPVLTRSKLVKKIIQLEPWLCRFEDSWVAEWILKKLIDQRVHDCNRVKAKEKRQKSLNKGKLLIYCCGL
jgi:hypothetical protein